MSASTEVLDSVKSRLGLTSDYALAKAVDWKPAQISNVRTNRRPLTEDQLAQLAEISPFDVLHALARIKAEYAKTPRLRQTWARIAEKAAA